MKIPLRIIRKKDRKIKEKEHVYCVLSAFLNCRKPRFLYKEIEFMVDTGSTNSCCIIEKDAKVMGIPFDSKSVKKVPEDEAPIAWTGKIKDTYTIKRVGFRCKSEEDGKLKLFKTEIPVAEIIKNSPEGIPSALGTRFLADNKLKLIFSPTEDIAYLEKVE